MKKIELFFFVFVFSLVSCDSGNSKAIIQNTNEQSAQPASNENEGRAALERIINKEAPRLIRLDKFTKTNGMNQNNEYIMDFDADIDVMETVTIFHQGVGSDYFKSLFNYFYEIHAWTWYTEYPMQFVGAIYEVGNIDEHQKNELKVKGQIKFEQTENGLRYVSYTISSATAPYSPTAMWNLNKK